MAEVKDGMRTAGRGDQEQRSGHAEGVKIEQSLLKGQDRGRTRRPGQARGRRKVESRPGGRRRKEQLQLRGLSTPHYSPQYSVPVQWMKGPK